MRCGVKRLTSNVGWGNIKLHKCTLHNNNITIINPEYGDLLKTWGVWGGGIQRGAYSSGFLYYFVPKTGIIYFKIKVFMV